MAIFTLLLGRAVLFAFTSWDRQAVSAFGVEFDFHFNKEQKKGEEGRKEVGMGYLFFLLYGSEIESWG